MKKANIRAGLLITMALTCSVAFSACTAQGEATDPGVWGYENTVTYDALGGMINARGVRTTYYMPNSYVFEPSGSSGMLVTPSRDGYILAGWYTGKADAAAGPEEHSFQPDSRWDFMTDRVQEDTTLYARWLPRARVSYIDADTGNVLFDKNITKDSPIQPLSESVLNLKTPAGTTFAGYYSDRACTIPYDFSAYTHVEPTPSEAAIYERLYEMFPQYLERTAYTAPAQDDAPTDNPWLFLNQLGYTLKTEDETALAALNAAKDSMVEENIQGYLKNTAGREIYVKFTQGRYIRVQSAADLKRGAQYGFFDQDSAGDPIDGYLIQKDIDLSGITFAMSESFTGTINGNGHTLSNLTVSTASKKLENVREKTVGLAAVMDGASISDLTFENAKLSVQVNAGTRVTGGLLAVQARNVTLRNCRFNGLTIVSGSGDDGTAVYKLGDLFGGASKTVIENCTAEGLVPEVRTPEKLVLSVFELPAAQESPADSEAGAAQTSGN